jgi:hypothetical protein
MDTDDLSAEAYQLIVLAQKMSDFLKTDLGVLAGKSKNEKEYLKKAFTLIQDILHGQDEYLESWMLEERLDEKQLTALTKYIKNVQAIPVDERTHVEW